MSFVCYVKHSKRELKSIPRIKNVCKNRAKHFVNNYKRTLYSSLIFGENVGYYTERKYYSCRKSIQFVFIVYYLIIV